jgi:hypothetical protein
VLGNRSLPPIPNARPRGRIQQAIVDYLNTSPAGVDEVWGPNGVHLVDIARSVYGDEPTTPQLESAHRGVESLLKRGLVDKWKGFDDDRHRGRSRMWICRRRTVTEQETVDRYEAEERVNRDARRRQGLIARRDKLVAERERLLTEIEGIDKRLATQEPVSLEEDFAGLLGGFRKARRRQRRH